MTKELLLETISRHDSTKPIKSSELEKLLHLTGSEVRDFVREFRRSGVPIGTNGKGYYLCKTYEELIHTLADLRSRSMSMLSTIKSLEKTLMEFKGQGRLI